MASIVCVDLLVGGIEVVRGEEEEEERERGMEGRVRRRSPIEQFERVGRGERRGVGERVGSHGSVAGTRTVGRVKRRRHREGEEKVASGRGGRRTEGREAGVMEMMGPLRGEEGQKRFPIVKSHREGVLRRNRGGLSPYSYSRTSQLVVAASLARTMWVWKRRIGGQRHGRGLRGRLRPQGTPMGMVPMRVVLERRGFVMTSVSLSVRLFANRMAGHILLKVLGGFGWVMRGESLERGTVPLRALGRLFVLETAVARVQAYVFTLLRCLYRADMVKGGH